MTGNASPSSEREFDLGRAVAALSRDIARLAPGPLAQLRRGALRGAGAPAFWSLAERHRLPSEGERRDRWAAVMQGMAIMTPRGDARRTGAKVSTHDSGAPLGWQLAAGEDGRAAFSELRLLRLLNATGEARRDLALRACRMLASRDMRCDWRQFARLILYDDAAETARRVAYDYFAEVDAKRPREADNTDSNDSDRE